MMLETLLLQTFVHLPLVVGAYITFSLMRLPDLSLESGYVMGAALVASLAPASAPIPVLFTLAVVGGALVGLTTGVLNQYLGLPMLIASILSNGFFHGGIHYLLGTPLLAVTGLCSTLQSELFLVGAIALVVVVGAALLFHGELGHSFALYGNNTHFFRHQGMDARPVVIIGAVIANALAGLSGFLFAQSTGYVDMQIGVGIVLLCLTALTLGRMLHTGARPKIVVSLFGLVTYFLLQQALLRMGFDLRYFNSVQAGVLLLSLLSIDKKSGEKLKLDHLGV